MELAFTSYSAYPVVANGMRGQYEVVKIRLHYFYKIYPSYIYFLCYILYSNLPTLLLCAVSLSRVLPSLFIYLDLCYFFFLRLKRL